MTIVRQSRSVVKRNEKARDARMYMEDACFHAGSLIESLAELDDRELTELHSWAHNTPNDEIAEALHFECPAMFMGYHVALAEVDAEFEARGLKPRIRIRTTDALPRELWERV